MKILHCCLAAFYIDNYGYQENILPKIHKLQGHEVQIIASTETYVDNSKLGYAKPKVYKTRNKIQITRLPYVQWLPHFIAKKLRIYKGLSKILQEFKPEILFLHDCQFLSIIEIAKYKNNNSKVKIYIDSHTDFINSARSWVSKIILHRIIYKWCAKKIESYTNQFYPTLPLRADFLRDIYDIPEEKIKLLVLGVDDTIVDYNNRIEISRNIRNSLNIGKDDFVIVSGGKIDNRKKINILMRAVKELNNNNIKLIVFGSVNEETKNEIEDLAKDKNIRYTSWIKSDEIYKYFFASDLAFFPGTHSVLWEQAVGLGLPCIFKEWEGIKHIDLGNNCMFIKESNINEIKDAVLFLYRNNNVLSNMRQEAVEKGIPYFSYYNIAKRAIEA